MNSSPHFLTGSKAAIAKAGCTTFLRLPWDETTGPYAEGGLVNHAFLASLVPGCHAYAHPPEMPADDAQRAMIATAKAWMVKKGLLVPASSASLLAKKGDLVAITGLRAEVAFAYDPVTGRARELVDPLPLEGDTFDARWYTDPVKRAAYDGPGGPILDREICMRLDLVCMGVDAWGPFLFVGDWKFHFGPRGEPVTAQTQVELGILTASRAYGIDRARGAGIHVWAFGDVLEEECGEKDEHGEFLLGEAGVPEFSDFGLATLADEVRVWATLPANDAAPVPGAHCKERYCPATAACSATLEAAAQLIPAETLARKPIAGPLLDDEHAEWALTAGELLVEAGKQLVAKARKYADEHGGFRMKDGRVFSGLASTSYSPDLSKPGALDLMAKMGLEFAVMSYTTWAAIKKEGGEDGERIVQLARTELGKAGMLTPKKTVTYDARKPTPAPKADETRRAS